MAISSKFWYQIGYQSIWWKYQYQYRYRNFIAEKYQYQYRYQNFITEKYQYRIGIEYPYLHGISIVSVSKIVVSKTSGALCFEANKAQKVISCFKKEETNSAAHYYYYTQESPTRGAFMSVIMSSESKYSLSHQMCICFGRTIWCIADVATHISLTLA